MTPIPKPVPIPKEPKRIKRGQGPRKLRKSTVAQLKRELWGLFALYVKERDGDVCITCGKGDLIGSNRQAGHWIRMGGHGAVAYDPKNVHVQCRACNVFRGGEPHLYAAAILARYGQAEFDRMLKRSMLVHEWKRWELEELIAALKSDPSGVAYEVLYYQRYL